MEWSMSIQAVSIQLPIISSSMTYSTCRPINSLPFSPTDSFSLAWKSGKRRSKGNKSLNKRSIVRTAVRSLHTGHHYGLYKPIGCFISCHATNKVFGSRCWIDLDLEPSFASAFLVFQTLTRTRYATRSGPKRSPGGGPNHGQDDASPLPNRHNLSTSSLNCTVTPHFDFRYTCKDSFLLQFHLIVHFQLSHHIHAHQQTRGKDQNTGPSHQEYLV